MAKRGGYTDEGRFGGALGRRIAPGRLGGFWDDLYTISNTVAQGAQAAKQVQAGNAQVTVIPTKQGVTNYIKDTGASVAGGISTPMIVVGVGAVLALVLAMQGGIGGRPRRRR